ncbi:hypothetical protein BCR41DRAFT_187667 [Lobosporangium transversale]|uniref:Uncharacterized protein n=1 Tax=Lobosporangium transversale TaxID=64571 RepID=A0A1Y2GA83_9FUNG|nr:hypothetical protein BCR41DRAFT_187667 [Lobosporangium transversale]ORZ05312.1 hypothetical protein BCR41DRAFT_187667 [Lobosporangium transversale]|eukprot:XP_021877004.1 hypothetical protein BCR41DRAFT_187667 [Lobosporangium transversale]
MKDDAYRVIQQKLIDTFEEEKAQYMDEQAFELAKLEHRYNLVKEELQALQTEVNERQVLTERGVESTAEEEITEQCTLVIAQERVVQLEAELVALRNQNAKHEANANGYGVEVDELRRSEVCLKTELKRSESRLLKLQQELYEMKKHTELLEQSPKVDLHILEGARVHGNSEMRLEDDLVITRKDITMEQSGYDSMAERIIKLQEDCFMAQEEKLRTEGLLNRVQMELVAARDEVERLQASQDEVQNESSFYRNLEQELVQTKSSLKQLQAELKDHDAVVKDLAALRKQHEEMVAAALDQKTTWTTRLSSLTQQLEDQRLEYLHLKQAAEKGQGTPYDVDLESLMSEIQHLKTVLVEERRGSEEQIHALEGQIRQAEDMLQENQKEMERIKIQSKVAESELAALRGYQDEEKWRYDQHMDSISRLQSQLEDTVSKHTTVVDEATLREKRLRVEISALEKSKLELEAQVHSQIVYAEMQKAENHSQMDTIQKLQGDLVMFADKAPEVIHLRNSLTKLQDEHQQASEQTQLIVDLFEKLVPLPGESEKLNALEEIVISTLTNVRLLGYSIQPLTQVALQLIELQRSIVKSRASAPVERETQQIDGPGRDAGLLSNNNEPMNTSDHALEVKELQEKLVKAEHGILKLRQFIHEFQAEEKRTILELQQRLEESENENNHVRSQLAKAQAMLLTKSAELATLTDGSTSASATSLSQSPIQGQTEVQHLKQQPPPQQQGVESEPEYVQGRTLPTDEMFKVFEGTGQVHREAILALEPLRQQKVELERTLLDLRHRYEQSQKENDALLSELEEENQRLKARVMRMSPDTSSNEHQEKIRDLESEVEELMRQLKTAQREREFTRQDMRSLKAELAKRKAQA